MWRPHALQITIERRSPGVPPWPGQILCRSASMPTRPHGLACSAFAIERIDPAKDERYYLHGFKGVPIDRPGA